jgi:hypothetical protein
LDDRAADGGCVGIGQSIFVLIQQLLELIYLLFGGVPGVGEFATALVFGGFLELAQDVRRDLRRRILLAVETT